MNITHLLVHELTHQRPTVASDGAGGTTTTPVDLPALRCRISQASASERFYADQAQADHSQPIYAAASTDVRKGDLLTDADGRQWRVTAVVHPSKPAYVRADVELIETRGDP